ncbi:hypothetical protein CEP54_008563 [Fusarium duplospermum]|uniref:Nucleoside phosphorylase domain-containing protein n=1 Tax=Fusarium duplospermum TaxID=1325734 RepID=A0A428PVD7_9HYPO|nr:hypothetical protein CEP54_008563 [Fusarium duplospermum]
MATPPASRNDFEIAIVCALRLEYDAVCHLVDEFWDGNYGRAAGDPNEYTTGRIGLFNIVMVLLSGMGKVKAASATASLRSSYLNLELVLVTGICGGLPKTGSDKELVLGDVVVSNTVVQYDLGRRYPNEFETKDTLSDSLGRPPIHVQNLVARLATSRGIRWLEEQARSHLEKLWIQQRNEDEAADHRYPGAENDHLYPSSYLHKHRSTGLCRVCDDSPRAVCSASRKLSCRELGCDVRQSISRQRLQDSERLRLPGVFIGRFGSGDTVLKSGEDRDRIAKEHDLIAFEMEGAGAWDEIPCIIVKGICDYADSHKNKNWQKFAAATAASVAKALIEKYPRTDKPSDPRQPNGLGHDLYNNEPASCSRTSAGNTKPVSNTNPRTVSSDACHILAYDRNENFIPRPDIDSKLGRLLPFNSDEFHSAALWGLGGSGKTQIALQYAYNRCRDPNCSVFWVHADTEATFTQDYRTIAGVLGLGSRLEGAELLEAVRRGIESQKRWVIVVDNADDLGLFGVGQASGKRQGTLLGSIPKGPNGTVLWTSRDQRVDGSLVGPQRGIQVAKMTVEESRELLEKWRREVTPGEEAQEVESLLEELQWLPLAISQAGAYLYRTDTSVSEYLSQLKRETGRWRVLGEDEFDRHRRGDAQNSVLRTWTISIRRLKQDCQTAYTILHVLAFVDNQNIPVELLAAATKYKYTYRQEAQTTTKPRQREQTLKRAVRRLKDFSFRSASPRPEEQVKNEDPDNANYADELERAVRRLKDFSFMTEHRSEGNKPRFEMHKLVQDAARRQGRPEQAKQLLMEALDDARQFLGEDHESVLDCMDELVRALIALKEYDEADKLLPRLLKLRQDTYGENHPYTLGVLNLRGNLYFVQGRHDEAVQVRSPLLDLERQVLGYEHPSTLLSMYNLALSRRKQERKEEAAELMQECSRLRHKVIGANHPHTKATDMMLEGWEREDTGPNS